MLGIIIYSYTCKNTIIYKKKKIIYTQMETNHVYIYKYNERTNYLRKKTII